LKIEPETAEKSEKQTLSKQPTKPEPPQTEPLILGENIEFSFDLFDNVGSGFSFPSETTGSKKSLKKEPETAEKSEKQTPSSSSGDMDVFGLFEDDSSEIKTQNKHQIKINNPDSKKQEKIPLWRQRQSEEKRPSLSRMQQQSKEKSQAKPQVRRMLSEEKRPSLFRKKSLSRQEKKIF